ncbi:MAG: DUF362 domain-containing protein [Desulfobacterales bacterium]|nr:DUF362 domain-containing protein [Desulfobacterales bacterium]MDJ0876067.1 DUF362 domain-containing protein [Desulfobacterales bacterium]
MTQKRKIITRRDFLRTGSCAVMGTMMGFPLVARAAAQATRKSTVVLIRNANATSGYGTLDEKIVVQMLDEAVMVMLDTRDPGSAWRQIASPDDTVGIKSNVWGRLPTPGALERAITARLLAVGVDGNRIAVDDRKVRSNPVFKRATVLINIRPMRTHHWSGLGSLLKNYIMFVPRPWAYHGNACERLGTIWQEPHVAGKTRLNILVMLTPLFHGVGPHHFSRRYTWPYGGLIVSTDPVAADATGAQIIQAQRNRHFNQVRPISPRPLHIEAADTKFGLGNSHPDQITLVKLGWEDEGLI